MTTRTDPSLGQQPAQQIQQQARGTTSTSSLNGMFAASRPSQYWHHPVAVDAFTGQMMTTISHPQQQPRLFSNRAGTGHWGGNRHGWVRNPGQWAFPLARSVNNPHAHPFAQVNPQSGPSYSYPPAQVNPQSGPSYSYPPAQVNPQSRPSYSEPPAQVNPQSRPSYSYPSAQVNPQSGPSYSYPARPYVQTARARPPPILNCWDPIWQENLPSQVPERANRENKKVSGAQVNAKEALHTRTDRTAIDNSRIGQPRSTHAVEASHAHSTGSCTSAAAILEEKKPETGIQTSGSLSQVKVASTQESSPVAANPLSSAYRRSQTPSSRPRKKAKLASETDLGKEETEFVLYLSLQNIQPQAIAIELCRITQQFNNLGRNFDDKAGLLGHRVVKWLKTFQQCKKTEAEAERIVADLLAQGENQGWSTGPLSRARDYSKSLAEGKVPSQTRKIRQEEARCRQALKKWRVNNPDELPRPGMRTALERRAYDGMMMEATQNLAGPNKELMKRNLVEFWEHGTIGGKTIE